MVNVTTPQTLAPRLRGDDAGQGRHRIDAIWRALASVPDPEIPIVSIVELGIVRGVLWEGSEPHVRVTPTYSGCPAMDVIHEDIREALAGLGIREAKIDVALAPPWTTDWIAPEAKERLRSFGIAPPADAAARVEVSGISPLRRRNVPCPRCGCANTSLIAQFGSTACKAMYRCEGCREPFDYFKPI